MRTRARWTRPWIAIACLVAAACGSNVATPSGSLSGAWSGPIAGDASAIGTARLLLTQTGSGIAGSFTTTYPDARQNRSGTAGGTVVSNVVTMALTPSGPLQCAGGITLSGTLSATLTLVADRLTGTYSGLTCGGAVGGTVDLGRE
jgi:hypothetical protein